jgi:nucleoid-associated protein YgaU
MFDLGLSVSVAGGTTSTRVRTNISTNEEVAMSSFGAVAVWGGPVVQGSQHVVRLTRRGRLLRSLVLMGLVVALAAVWMGRLTGEPARAGTGWAPAVVTASVVVQQGDSLWEIAQRVSPGADPREVVSGIRDLNGLSSNLIQPGQVLLVPSDR